MFRTIGIICFSITLFCSVFFGYQYFNSRRLCNQLRERITDAEDTNRKLADTVARCQDITGELDNSVSRNIQTARDAVELIEEIRVQVQSLRVVTGDFSWDDYYKYWDNVFGIEQ